MMEKEMENNFSPLYKKLGYKFKDEELLLRALSHRSSTKDHNERLEFLGDSVVGFVIANELYHQQPDAKEGDLSRLRSQLVNAEMLLKLARDIELSDFLLVGQGERKSGATMRQSILADSMEAVIGAIYVDGGMDAVKKCILRLLGERVNDFAKLKPKKDAKSRLQEWTQSRSFELPQYDAKISGKAHAQTFRVICRVPGLKQESKGISTSRRKAEQLAAAAYLELIED